MYTTLPDLGRFLATLYGGLLAGVAYDLLRAVGLVFQRPWQRALLDMLFWLIAGVLLAQTLLYVADGRPRLYVFIGFGTGLAAYIFGVSRLIDILLSKKRLH